MNAIMNTMGPNYPATLQRYFQESSPFIVPDGESENGHEEGPRRERGLANRTLSSAGSKSILFMRAFDTIKNFTVCNWFLLEWVLACILIFMIVCSIPTAGVLSALG